MSSWRLLSHSDPGSFLFDNAGLGHFPGSLYHLVYFFHVDSRPPSPAIKFIIGGRFS